MEAYIDATLRRVIKDFDATKAQAGKLCDCKTLTYEGGNSPNYDTPLVQQIYMLRYFPAYLAEYYLMYVALLGTQFLPQKLNVLSIGCGCGVDLWALHFAMQAVGRNPATDIDYTGIDVAAWQYQDTMAHPNVRFIRQDITQWNVLDRSDYNVFVFPKCIGEFPPNVYGSIRSIFRNSSFIQGRVCGLCSLMKMGLDADAARFREIAQIMTNAHGFQCIDELDKYWHVPEEKGIRAVCYPCVYPTDILTRMRQLIEECPTRLANGQPCKTDCTSRLNRSPILKTTFINYKLLRFKRPEQAQANE